MRAEKESFASRSIRMADLVARNLLVIALVAAVILALIFYFFAWPGGDDLRRFMRGQDRGVFGAVAYEYFHWTGRWAGIGLSYLLSSLVDLKPWYPALLIGISGCLIASVKCLVHALGEKLLAYRHSWAIAGVVFVVFWAGMQRPADTLYRMTAAIENILSVALGTAIVALLLRVRPKSAGLREAVPLGALVGVGTFITVGMHELYGSMLVLVLAVGTAQSFRLRSRSRMTWLLVTISGVVGLGLVVAAPGNYRRAAHIGEISGGVGSLGDVLPVVIGQVVHKFGEWLLDLRLVGATLLFLSGRPFSKERPTWPDRRRAYWEWVIPATGGVAILWGFSLPIFLRGGKAPPRVVDGLYLVFLLTWLACAYVGASRIEGFCRQVGGRLLATVRIGAALLLTVALGWPAATLELRDRRPVVRQIAPHHDKIREISDLFRSNVNRALRDLQTTLLPYREAVERRWDYVGQLAGADKMVLVEPLPVTPYMVRSVELSTNPNDSLNRAFAQYFGVSSLRRVDPTLGEVSLGEGRWGKLMYSGPPADELGIVSSPLRRPHGVSFRLRAGTAEIKIVESGRPRPVAACSRLWIRGTPTGLSPVKVTLELWSLGGTEGRVLASSTIDLSPKDEWTVLTAALPSRTSADIGSVRLRLDPLESSNRPVVRALTVARIRLFGTGEGEMGRC